MQKNKNQFKTFIQDLVGTDEIDLRAIVTQLKDFMFCPCEIKEEEIDKKAAGIANDIMFVQKLYDDEDFKEAHSFAIKLGKKIKNIRQTGLDQEGGSYSVENLAFKALRNHGYLERLSTIKTLSYDRMMSLPSEKLIKAKIK